jgi:hypothetical protein
VRSAVTVLGPRAEPAPKAWRKMPADPAKWTNQNQRSRRQERRRGDDEGIKTIPTRDVRGDAGRVDIVVVQNRVALWFGRATALWLLVPLPAAAAGVWRRSASRARRRGRRQRLLRGSTQDGSWSECSAHTLQQGCSKVGPLVGRARSGIATQRSGRASSRSRSPGHRPTFTTFHFRGRSTKVPQ